MTVPPGGGFSLKLDSNLGQWTFEPGARALIGRDPAAGVSLPIPDVSRKHAELFYDGNAWVVQDLNSANGLWVDGQRVPQVRITRPLTFALGPAPQAPRFAVSVEAARPVRQQQGPAPFPPQQFGGSQPPQPPQFQPSAPGFGGPTGTQFPPPGPSAPGTQFPGRPGTPQSGFGPGPAAPGAWQSRPQAQPQPAQLAAEIPSGTVLAYGQVASAERREVGAGTITIGRARDNTFCIDDMLASRHHARLQPDGRGGFSVEDLGSANGTFINGRAVRQGHVGPGDVVTVGKRHFAVDRGALVEIVESSRVSFAADQISYVLPDGKQLLDTLQFELGPSSLTAVIGPSGAGKSTLFRVLTGENRPHTGTVYYNGRSLHDNYADVRQRLGVVPQDDVIHRQLTVDRALQYAAELRFPDDLDRASRDRRVAETMQELDLTKHAKTPVSRLSGGQRKRVSVAMELLTQPSLLFLDEPTSGLDPGLDKQVMQLLRELADGDRTVMVITHSVANLGLCDNVLLLAPGGKQAYFGPPDGLLPYFGMKDYADVFEAVAENPDYARDRFRATHPLRESAPPPPPAAPQQQSLPPKKKSFTRQMSTLTRRQLRVMLSDRSYTIFTFAMPVAIGLLTIMIPGKDAFNKWQRTWFTGHDGHSSQEGMMLLVIIIVGAVFSGMAASARELVNERPIYKREQSVGLRASSYLWSKLFVLWLFTGIQSAIMILILTLTRHAAEVTLVIGLPWLEMFGIVWATAFVCAVLGLLLSSFVSTNEQVMPLLVVFVMAQLVFTGGLFRVDKAVVNQLSWLFPSRWGFGGTAASVDIRAVSPGAADDWLWTHDASRFWLCMGMLLLQGLVFGTVTFARVAKKQK